MLASYNIPIGKVIKVMSVAVCVTAFLTLVGWFFDIPSFKSVFEGYQTMKVNTAVCFLLVGIGLMVYKPQSNFQFLPSITGALVISTALISVFQDIFNVDFGIDELLIAQSESIGMVKPGRMAPTTAVSFILIAFGLFTKEKRCGDKVIPFVVVPLLQLVSTIAIIGYFFKVPVFYKWSFVSSMAFNTAVLIFLISLILSLHYPKKGFFGLLNGTGYGNIVARRIFPALVVSILLLSFVRISASRLQLVTEEFGIIVFAYSFIIVSTVIVTIVAIQLNRLDRGRAEAQASLASLHNQLRMEFELATFQLQESQTKFRSIFELSPVGIAISDLKSGKIVEVNEAFAKNLGYEMDDIIGKTSIELNFVSPEVRQGLIEKLTASGQLRHEEIEMNDRFGNKRFVIFSTNVIAINDHRFSLTVQYDITERKKLEEELTSARQRAENSSIVKERFMSNMSHEIRTPLNAIIGFTSLIEGKNLTSEQFEYLQFVRSSGSNLLNLVNDILDYSKIEAGMLRIEKIPFNVYDLAGSLKLMFSEKARQQNLEWEVSVDTQITQILEGDPTRITQILTNLLANAFKFTSRGKVSLHVSKSERQNDLIEFSVKDSGIGISEEQMSKVFERFVQASDETTRMYGGTGLGLSIVNSLAGLLGGTLRVDSKVGEGTEFAVTIPLHPFAVSPTNTHYSEPVQSTHSCFPTPVNVLVAEDNKMNQILAVRVLDKMNCKVDIADNGGIAIEMLKVKKYDIVLMDIQMPIVDGYTAARTIRNELRVKTPIVAMTAHVMAGEKDRCTDAGMNDYISKPYVYELLFTTIKRNLNLADSNQAA